MVRRKTKRKDTVIYLKRIIHDVNENQEPTEETVKRPVMAAKKRVLGREFYAAAAFDMRPEIVFEVYEREYQGEEIIEYNGTDYQLIRTDDNGSAEDVELICSGPGPRPRTR